MRTLISRIPWGVIGNWLLRISSIVVAGFFLFGFTLVRTILGVLSRVPRLFYDALVWVLNHPKAPLTEKERLLGVAFWGFIALFGCAYFIGIQLGFTRGGESGPSSETLKPFLPPISYNTEETTEHQTSFPTPPIVPTYPTYSIEGGFARIPKVLDVTSDLVTSKYLNGVSATRFMLDVEYIVIHHTGETTTLDPGQLVSAFSQTLVSRGMGEARVAPYHFYLRKDGTIYQLLPTWVASGHTESELFAFNSIAIALEGNFEVEYPSAQQVSALNSLVPYLMVRFGVSLERVLGHQEVPEATLCPGRYLNLEDLRLGWKSIPVEEIKVSLVEKVAGEFDINSEVFLALLYSESSGLKQWNLDGSVVKNCGSLGCDVGIAQINSVWTDDPRISTDMEFNLRWAAGEILRPNAQKVGVSASDPPEAWRPVIQAYKGNGKEDFVSRVYEILRNKPWLEND